MTKSITAVWFETKVRYQKTMDNGVQKTVRETYVVDALSFTEAESRITSEMQLLTQGEFQVVEEKIAPYKELLYSDASSGDKFYKAKVQFITIDEKTGNEKRNSTYVLVSAANIEDAHKTIDEYRGTMVDYVISSVSETAVIEVFQYRKGKNG